jgi:hypothetical protein
MHFSFRKCFPVFGEHHLPQSNMMTDYFYDSYLKLFETHIGNHMPMITFYFTTQMWTIFCSISTRKDLTNLKPMQEEAFLPHSFTGKKVKGIIYFPQCHPRTLVLFSRNELFLHKKFLLLCFQIQVNYA